MGAEFFDDKEGVRNLYREIADLKIRKREIEESLKTKEAIALKHMAHVGADNIDTDFGKFIKVPYTRWEFSSNVSQLSDSLKHLQEEEKKTGIAKSKVSGFSIRYLSKKS